MTVNVACDTTGGVASDSQFDLSFFTDTAFGVNQGQEQRRGAFVWADDPAAASYTPSLHYQYNSAGGPIRAHRSGLGTYAVDIPGLIALDSSNVQVSRYQGAGYCNVQGWGSGPNNGATVSVRCYSTTGAAQDARFVLTYLTDTLATAALPSPGGPARAKAWVFSDGTGTNANPNALYQFNSAGGTNSVTRLSTGAYRVNLPNLGTASGVVHVNAYGGSAYCKAHSWGPNGATQEIYVMCFDPGGNTVDSQFSVLFYKEDRTGASFNAGYARSFIPIASAAVQPPSAYSWNGRLLTNEITRTSIGRYNVTFSGVAQSPNGGSVMVTPYGATPTRCKVSSWAGSTAHVRCHQIDGALIDADFGISYIVDVAFGSDTLANAHPGGYAWAQSSATASYQPDTSFRFNSAGGTFLAQRSSAGAYSMEFSLLKAFSKTVPIVTAYGEAAGELGAYCRPDSWLPKSGAPGTAINVGCFNAAGARVDSRYTVVYLTTPLAPTSVTVSGGSPQSAQVGTTFTVPLQATVRDANIPIAGVNVNFAAPGSGPSASLSGATVVSNASGQASVTATANGLTGNYNVTASVTGIATPATFALTNQPVSGLGAPVFISPANNSTLTNTIVTFSWSPVAAANRYELKVIEAATPQQFRVELAGPASTLAIYTLPSGNYRAEVRACNDSACGPTGIVNFLVQGGAIPAAAVTGVNCAIVNDSNQNRLNCNWTALAGANFYFVNVVQPGAGPGGGALTVAGQQVGVNSISILIPNGAATVLVRGCTGDGCGPFSSGTPINGTIGNPLTPILGEPMAGSSVDFGSNAPEITFTWNLVAGDNGTNFMYRLYVQDFSRNAPALDILTSNNFHGAFFNPGTRFDALVIAIPNGGGLSRQGPPSGFVTRGRVPRSPVVTSPTYRSAVDPNAQGQVNVAWTPQVNPDGTVSTRNYQYFFNGPGQTGGVTTSLSVLLNLAPGDWQGVVRACTTGTSCVESLPTGWGPWNNEPGSEGGIADFRVR